MPKTNNNLLLQYWDKALLALLAIIVLFIFFTRVRSSPIEAANQNGAKNLTKKLTQDADRLADRLKKSRLAEPPRESTDDPDLFGPDIELAEGYQGNLTQTPLTMFPPGGGTVKVAGNIPTPEVLAPLALQVQTSLGIPAPTTTSANTGAPESQQQIHWVTVAAKFPFRQQYERFAALDQNVVPENEVHLLFVRLELQREELQPDGSWSQAVSVNPYELYEGRLPSATGTLADPYSLPRRQEEMQNRDSFRSWLASAGFQEFIARPDFLPLTSFEEWIWPQQLPTGDDDLPAPVLSGKIPKDSAPKYREITAGGTRRSGRATVYRPTPNATTRQPGFEGVTIFGGGPNLMGGYQPSPTTTPTTTRRTSSRRSGERSQIPQTYKTLYDSDRGPEDVEIWAHDAAAEPGKVYRYRMRVLLSNPLCGKERAETRTVRQQSWLTGQWSQWSEPIRVLQDREFFFTGVRKPGSKPPQARVQVLAWHQGWWYSAKFNCGQPGQEIGGRKRIQEYVLPQNTRTASHDEPPRPPAKVEVDFFTGWEVKKFTPELEPQPGQPDRTQVVEAAELIAGQVGSDLTVTKRYVKDAEEDPLLLRLEEIIERQEEATEEETRPRPRPGQRRAPHY